MVAEAEGAAKPRTALGTRAPERDPPTGVAFRGATLPCPRPNQHHQAHCTATVSLVASRVTLLLAKIGSCRCREWSACGRTASPR